MAATVKPPTNEIGVQTQPVPQPARGSAMLTGWTSFVDEHEYVPELIWPARLFLLLMLVAFDLQRRHLLLREDAFRRFHEGFHALLGAAVLVTFLDQSIHFRLLLRRKIQFREGFGGHLRVLRATGGVLVLVAGERRGDREGRRCHQSQSSKFCHSGKLGQCRGRVVQILRFDQFLTAF